MQNLRVVQGNVPDRKPQKSPAEIPAVRDHDPSPESIEESKGPTRHVNSATVTTNAASTASPNKEVSAFDPRFDHHEDYDQSGFGQVDKISDDLKDHSG